MSRCKEYIPLRIDSKLLDGIDSYREKESINNRSEAIRRLIEIGLSLPPQPLHNGGSVSNEISEKNGRRDFHINEWGQKVYH